MGLGVLTTSNCCTAKERNDILTQLSYEYDSSTECFYIILHVIFHIHTIYAMLSTYNAIYCLLNWCNELSHLQKFDSSNISYSPNVYLNQNSYFSCISKLICPFAKFWNNSWPFEPFHLLGAHFSAHKTQTH